MHIILLDFIVIYSIIEYSIFSYINNIAYLTQIVVKLIVNTHFCPTLLILLLLLFSKKNKTKQKIKAQNKKQLKKGLSPKIKLNTPKKIKGHLTSLFLSMILPLRKAAKAQHYKAKWPKAKQMVDLSFSGTLR